MTILDGTWETLAEMLRREITGYGKLFGMLEKQREHLLSSDFDGLMAGNGELMEFTELLNGYRKEREAFVGKILKEKAGSKGKPTVKRLLEHSPDETLPLFEELLNEVNRLVDRTRVKLEKNQMLFRRSRDISQQFFKMINPEAAADTKVYGYNGRQGGLPAAALMSRYQVRA